MLRLSWGQDGFALGPYRHIYIRLVAILLPRHMALMTQASWWNAAFAKKSAWKKNSSSVMYVCGSFSCSMLLKLETLAHGHLRLEIPLLLAAFAKESNLLGKYSHHTTYPVISKQDVGKSGNRKCSS